MTQSSRPSPRVALVTNVLAHYRVPCFRRLGEALPTGLDLFLLTESMAHRHYVMAQGDGEASAASQLGPAVRTEVLPGRSWRRPPFDDVHWNQTAPVHRGRYDVLILGGWAEPTFLELWLRHWPRRTRVFFWVESTLRDSRRVGWKEWPKRLLLAGAAGCLVPGRRSAAYCAALGMPRERIHTAPNATDGAWFRRQAEALAPQRSALRGEFGLDGPTALFVGRLVETFKGIEGLLRAVALVPGLRLLMAGEGPDRGAYEALATQLELGDRARFLGNLDHERLCRAYAAVDMLVLPSRSETWGFVLNEGMEFGLPLVVSDAVGAVDDLVVEGDNGFIVPSGDVRALGDALGRLARDEALRLRLGEASRRRIEAFSPDAWARGVLAAVEGAAVEGAGR